MIADLIANVIDKLTLRKYTPNRRTASIEVAKRKRQMTYTSYFTAWTPDHARTIRDHLDHQTFGAKNEDDLWIQAYKIIA